MRKILIVDDDASQRRLFCRRLAIENFEAAEAASAHDALNRIGEQRPDLVLADIGMPEMDGIRMLKALRQAPETAAIPVILMTGMLVPDSLLQAAADSLGAGPIHVKGDFRTLFEWIRSIFKSPTSVTRKAANNEHVFRKGLVSVDIIHREVTVAGRKIPKLAAKRFDLLLSLLRHDGPVDQRVLLRDVWGRGTDPKSVQMTVARLREDLRSFPALQIKTTDHSYELVITLTQKKVNN